MIVVEGGVNAADDRIVSLANKNNLCIIEITEANLKNEPQFVQDWCKDKFVELDTIKLETEQQEVKEDIEQTNNQTEEEK